jgi:hypothetical protein
MSARTAAPQVGVGPDDALSPVTSAASRWQRLVGRIEGGVCAAGEPREARLRKVQFTFATLLVVPAAVLWGGFSWQRASRWPRRFRWPTPR